jgi:hypothetical protein
MLGSTGAWIRTEKGIRRVTLEETARGLGLTKELNLDVTPSLIAHSTSVFHWEYLSASLVRHRPLCRPDRDTYHPHSGALKSSRPP